MEYWKRAELSAGGPPWSLGFSRIPSRYDLGFELCSCSSFYRHSLSSSSFSSSTLAVFVVVGRSFFGYLPFQAGSVGNNSSLYHRIVHSRAGLRRTRPLRVRETMDNGDINLRN